MDPEPVAPSQHESCPSGPSVVKFETPCNPCPVPLRGGLQRRNSTQPLNNTQHKLSHARELLGNIFRKRSRARPPAPQQAPTRAGLRGYLTGLTGAIAGYDLSPPPSDDDESSPAQVPIALAAWTPGLPAVPPDHPRPSIGVKSPQIDPTVNS